MALECMSALDLAALGEIESDFVRLPLVPARKESAEALVAVVNSLSM